MALASVETGGHGEAAPRFRLPDWPDGNYRLEVTARPRGAGRPESVVRPVALKHSWRVMASTDKPVYQPGQVIHIRGLALRRPDLRPVAGQPMAFSLTDPRGNVVFREVRPSSRFGIGSADCPIAGEVIEGPYQVECRIGETTAGATVEVRHYVLPRFKVNLTLDQSDYRPGQVIKGRVQADYVFGKPVAEGVVTVNMETEDVGPRVLQSLSLKTDAAGSAAFELRTPETVIGRLQHGGAGRIAVTATVRDPAGQTQARTESRMMSTQPFRIEVVPEAGTLVLGLPNTIHLLTTTLDGRPVRARIEVSGIEQPVQSSELGVASFAFTPRADVVNWTIRATDDQGRTAIRKVTLTGGMVEGGDYLVRTDKAVYDGGEPVRVTVLATGGEPVFLELIKDGQSMLTTSIAVEKGRGERAIDLPPELFGTVVLNTYRYGVDGMPAGRSRVIQVRPARALAVRMTPDRAEYRPGERASLGFTLTDDRGQPAPGAISLAAVDEAVFGVLERRPGLEKTFFTLEQELLKPVYEIEDWSLDDPAPAEERTRLELALFSRTSRGFRDVPGDGGDEPVATGASAHSLTASSYPQKVRDLESWRQVALSRMNYGWAGLVVVAILGAFVWSLVNRQYLTVFFVAFIVMILFALLLPATQSAREAARNFVAAMPRPEEGPMAMTKAPGALPTSEAGAKPVRVRRDFPETLLWRPELITDDQGHARLDLDLADSITTWRVSMGAVAADGRLGAAVAPIRVFQPFFVDVDLPSALTRGDEIGLPVIVSNFLDRPQSVTVSLREAPWFARLEPSAERTLELRPNEVRATHFRIRALAVGSQEIEVTARGASAAFLTLSVGRSKSFPTADGSSGSPRGRSRRRPRSSWPPPRSRYPAASGRS